MQYFRFAKHRLEPSTMDIPIIISAFDRPNSLSRILTSVARAHYDRQGVKLYISIDGGGDPDCRAIAERFKWKYGEKEIITHTTNLGLKKHILACSDLSLRHDGIIVLEDDLFVGLDFYSFAQASLRFYKTEHKLAGVSLYTHSFNETAQLPFCPLSDGSDTFFIQLPSSWGQCYLREHWAAFKAWFSTCPIENPGIKEGLPPDVSNWPATSWKKHFIHYMIAHDLYFVFPYNSRSTNFGDAGVNHKGHSHFQVPLTVDTPALRLKNFGDSFIKYDSYCELLPACLNHFTDRLAPYDYQVDLYGVKNLQPGKHKYVLTSRSSSSPVLSFGRSMVPHEANIIYGNGANEIFLSKVKDIETVQPDKRNKNMVFYYRMPRWYLKEKMDREKNVSVRLSEDEDRLLRIYSKRIGKIIFSPILALHSVFLRMIYYLKKRGYKV